MAGSVPWPTTTADGGRFLLGLVGVYALFEVTARSLGSDRGQAGLIVGAVVLAATVAVDRWLSGGTLRDSLVRLGLGAPRAQGLAGGVLVAALLFLVVPAWSAATGATWTMHPGWALLVPGLFAQAGIAEEVLFRGYLFGRLRPGRTFWRAALLASGPFVLVHLAMFATMPWAVALLSVGLAALISFPLAWLFERGGGTIWGPAVAHFAVQGFVKIVVFDDTGATFPIAWVLASAVLPFVVFAFRPDRPPGGDPDPAYSRGMGA